MKKQVIFILLVVFSLRSAIASTTAPVDPLDLAAVLLKDGYTQRAKSVLEKVDVKKRGFDFPRFYTLKGILLQRQSYPTLSNIFLLEAIKKGQKNTSTYLYIARNYWNTQEYEKVLSALQKAGPESKQNPDMYAIRAEAQKALGRNKEAWLTLNDAITAFPEEQKFFKQKFYYLLDFGLYQEAEVYAKNYLKGEKSSAKDYLAFAYVLRENAQYKLSAQLLEEALIRYPNDEKIIELLGQVYIDQESYTAAALVYDHVSMRKYQFAEKASPLYMKAKQPVRALQINRRILNQKEKFLQRVGIDIYFDDYESLMAKQDALKRYGLFNDENIIYAMAYAFYRNGEYDKATEQAKRIKSEKMFESASNLLSEIEKCKNEPDVCT